MLEAKVHAVLAERREDLRRGQGAKGIEEEAGAEDGALAEAERRAYARREGQSALLRGVSAASASESFSRRVWLCVAVSQCRSVTVSQCRSVAVLRLPKPVRATVGFCAGQIHVTE
eukprot:2986852-Rhodomonas_salina.5